MSDDAQPLADNASTGDAATEGRGASNTTLSVALFVVFVLIVIVGALVIVARPSQPVAQSRNLLFFNRSDSAEANPRFVALWWGNFPDNLPNVDKGSLRQTSNIHPDDYVGPDGCKDCHPRNYKNWSKHPHRWMNALADEATVLGDFSDQKISYKGGTATFYEVNGEYRMRLQRETTRDFVINQTIGSRFYQYYIGKQISGPEQPDEKFYREDHVLPFGYWLKAREWVPVVHIFDEEPDEKRLDPFDADSYSRDFSIYARSCNTCHTTFAMGDLLCGSVKRMAREVPRNVHWSASNYLSEVRSDVLSDSPEAYSEDQLLSLLKELDGMEAPAHAITLGVSCEACHLGGREHAENPRIPPHFFPRSPHLRVEGEHASLETGRSHDNVNWACGRCHSGNRPQFAGGMATWNSTEYSDAMRGSCYSELRCVDCHNPHQATGPQWSRPPAEDDALCIRCHDKFDSPRAQADHSHHPAGSAGSRCMNCHMPRLNEGLQDVVRTHTIFSPTQPKMIHANQPNACNQCHTKESIDWTLNYLSEWYGAEYPEKLLDKAYPDRVGPVAIGWLKSDNEAVRLVAADSLTRTRSAWALNPLVDTLDDPYLLNRQFAQRGLETMLGIRLADHGYRFYMMAGERKQPIAEIRQALMAGPSERDE